LTRAAVLFHDVGNSGKERQEMTRSGRQPLGPFAGKHKTFTTRITPETRARLDAAAAESGRSLSQEIELRLERSFQTADALAVALTEAFGRQGATLQRLLRDLMRPSGAYALTAESDWLSDATAFGELEGAFTHFLARLRPTGTPDRMAEARGRERADRLLRMLGEERDAAVTKWATWMREGLGRPIADHLIEMRRAECAEIEGTAAIPPPIEPAQAAPPIPHQATPPRRQRKGPGKKAAAA